VHVPTADPAVTVRACASTVQASPLVVLRTGTAPDVAVAVTGRVLPCAMVSAPWIVTVCAARSTSKASEALAARWAPLLATLAVSPQVPARTTVTV
jgi:hypothetical protein